MSNTQKIGNSLRRYLSPTETHSIQYENASNASKTPNIDFTYESEQSLIDRGRKDLAKLKTQIIYAVSSFVVTEIIHKYFNTELDKKVLHKASSGLYGYYIYFRSNRLKDGFKEIIDRNNIDITKKTRLAVIDDTFESDSMVGLKVQIFYNSDPYYETKAIREEKTMEFLNRTVFQEYIPKFHFGCTVSVPVEIGNETRIAKVRLTFMEHLGEYERIKDYLDKKWEDYNETSVVEQKKEIREKMKGIRDKLQEIINKLWNVKVSHNDFHWGNIMIRTKKILDPDPPKNTITPVKFFDVPIIKLIDYGNATRITRNTDITQESYNNYYAERFKKELNSGDEGEGLLTVNSYSIV